MDDPADKYFKCTDRERAIFEAGIKLGAIYHQYTGIPVNQSNLDSVRETIEKSTIIQPFVRDIHVTISQKNKFDENSFKYTSLKGEMLDINLIIQYRDQQIKARMKFVEDLKYPLMYLEE